MSRQPPTRGERPDVPGEPSLAVRRTVPWFRRRRFLLSFVPVVAFALAGLIALSVFAEPLLPFKELVTFRGSMGAQARFFEDEQIRELLLRHHIRVEPPIRQGSIAAATGDLDSLDFVFASGQPAAERLIDRRGGTGEYYSLHRPFVSALVLATYRDYAETLRAQGVATPQDTPGSDQPDYYYTLNMEAFLDRVRKEQSWDDLNGLAHGVINGNQVLAHTPNVCESNSGETYAGLISYVVHDRVPGSEQEATDFGTDIKPLIESQGLESIAPETYFGEDGRQAAPIIVLYEHQYLAHQLDNLERSGELDSDRVLLYPDAASQTHPLFVALNDNAARLGRLLITEPDLRRRAVGLGFGVLPTAGTSGEELSRYLAERGVPVPSPGSDTQARLPNWRLLEKMAEAVGGCPRMPE